MPLSGLGAVVTGGGRGIGAAVARALCDAGARVIVAARSQDEIDATARELRDAGHEAFAEVVDVTDEQSVAHLAERATELLASVDILVNNAGAASASAFAAIELEEWNRLIAVNATGTFLCTRAFLPPMVERGWGRVVNVASIAGKAGAAYISAYSAAKHAVVGLTRSVASEYAKSGVTVNAVCPGYVATDMTEASVARIVEKTGRSKEDALEAIRRQSPQGRVYEAEEVAYLVAALCDRRAGGVNGQAIPLDGGSVQS